MLKMSERIIIHIGLPKTGTSYLQVDVFPNIPNLQVLRGWESFRDLIDIPKDQRIMISDEYFSCKMFTEGIYSQLEDRIKRIKNVFNNPIVIVGFRKQQEFVLSYYKQYLHGGGDLDIHDVFNIQNSGILKLEDLYYKNWLDTIEENFEDVFIYSNESLRKKFNAFITAFCLMTDLGQPDVKGMESKTRNVGVRSLKQIEFLVNENRKPKKVLNQNIMNRVIRKIMVRRHLSSLEKALKMDVIAGEELLSLSNMEIEFLDATFEKDWKYIESRVSY
jgi:hypothetical protein